MPEKFCLKLWAGSKNNFLEFYWTFLAIRACSGQPELLISSPGTALTSQCSMEVIIQYGLEHWKSMYTYNETIISKLIMETAV